MSTPVQKERIRALNDRPTGQTERHVLYWMQQSQRARGNHALEHAVARANQLGLPLVVGFGLDAGYPEANERSFAFLLEGLAETSAALARRGCPLVVRQGSPAQVAVGLARDAALVVCDRGYLRHQRRWRRHVADELRVAVEQVEADVVVPVDSASNKREFAARTLRPKLQRLWPRFLRPLPAVTLAHPLRGGSAAWRALGLAGDVDVRDPRAALAGLAMDRSLRAVPAVSALHPGGTSHALRRLRAFLADTLPRYARDRRRPERESFSQLSMYLHFGQIAPLEVALAARRAPRTPAAARAAFLEELLVRRELACNFVEHSEDYDRFDGLPDWARATLLAHAGDPRRPEIDAARIEAADTGDRAFDAAMREMKATGYLPNALRMYWGKKIIEWSASPQQAFATALRLNNRYFLDGRDPSSYANIAWLFGLHDRPFKERSVFGKIRYLSAAGLERKMDLDAYVQRLERRLEVLAR